MTDLDETKYGDGVEAISLEVTRLSYSQHHSYSNLYHYPNFLLAAHLHYSVNFLFLGMALLHLTAFHKDFMAWFQSQHSMRDFLFHQHSKIELLDMLIQMALQFSTFTMY